MTVHSRRAHGAAPPPPVGAPVLRSGGEGSHAPFDIPLEQAVALAQFPRHGILDMDLARRLGMTPAESAKLRGVLLRRKLVRRTPAGRARAGSRLLLTARGQQAGAWLEQLQTSLPANLFDGATPTLAPPPWATGSAPEAVGISLRDSSGGPLGVVRRLWMRWRHREALDGLRERSEEGIFERGMLYVWLGTGSFAGAVLVGILLQTERAALVALGFGCLLAVIFFGRAGIVAFRNARARAEHRPRHWGWHRHHSRPGRVAH
jgi:DNA-binding MarR family transcriptional regulator